jgi:type IV pilus assembly protein PilE
MPSKASMSGFTRGFTLVELLVTVVVFAVVVAIALPAYQGKVRESRRAEARALLLDAANREHRFFADNSTYTTTVTSLGFANPALSENGAYVLSAVTGANGFTVTATPQGSQAADTPCATLSLASTGVKSSTGGAACW